MTDQTRNVMDLIVWQRAMALVPEAYAAVRLLPAEEKYAMGDQIRRTAVSVPSNIAEGHDRHHAKEFIQYLGVAKGSLAELETLFLVAGSLGYLSDAHVSKLRDYIADIRRPLHGLIEKTRGIQPPHSRRALRANSAGHTRLAFRVPPCQRHEAACRPNQPSTGQTRRTPQPSTESAPQNPTTETTP